MIAGNHDSFPRVVVVSANPICSYQGNGIFMQSLFLGWPRDRLSQIYFPIALVHLPDTPVCGEYRLIRPWGTVRRVSVDNPFLTALAENAEKAAHTASRPWLHGTVARITHRPRLMRWLRPGLELWIGHSWLVRVLERQLRELQPDIVYAALGNYCLTKITYLACERLGIPMFIHVTDDFVKSMYSQMPFSRRLQSTSEQWFRRAVVYADGLAAISPVMAEEYDRRYGKQWGWFTTLVDVDAYDPTPRPADGTMRLVYAGHLSLERWRSLRELALAVQSIRDKQGINVQLDIYGPPEQISIYRDAMQVPQVTQLSDWLPSKELPRVFHDADILVHVESFNPAVANYTRFSFSTKLSQYMMAERCILMFGPHESGSSRMVRIADAGLTIDADGTQSLTDALHRFLVDSALRDRYGRNGRLYAMKWFEARSARDRFWNAIAEALERSRGRRSE